MRANNIQEAALAVVRRLREHGHQALWAGGCVRDMLLGYEPADIDIATDAPPDRVSALFSNTRKVGAKFGVVLVRQSRYWIETATFRTDLSYRDGRRPEAVVYSTPQEDAQRRDFTINGLFYDPVEHTVIDHVGGQADLQARIIRAIGEPDRRFAEDHLRLLRAVRFATRFEFQIEPATAAAIKSHAPDLRRISPERIREELEKMLTRSTRARAIALIAELDLLPHLWPGAETDLMPLSAQTRAEKDPLATVDLSQEVFEGIPEVVSSCEGGWNLVLRRLDALPGRSDFELAMAAFLHSVSPPRIEDISRALRCSNQRIADIVWLVRGEPQLHQVDALTLSQFKRLLAHGRWSDLLALHAAVLAAAGRPAATHEAARRRAAGIPHDQIAPPPLVTGDDLLALGLQPGPRYKEILDTLYDAQLNQLLTDRPTALARLRELAS